MRKLRGSASLTGKHAFSIIDRGDELFPRIESLAPLPPAIGGPRRGLGTEVLDRMTQGGLPRGRRPWSWAPPGRAKRLASYEITENGFEVTGAVADADGILGGPSLRADDIDAVGWDEQE